MYKFWYDYLKPKYGENVNLCYMDTDSFIFHVKTDLTLQILKQKDRRLKEKIKKVIELMKDE